MHQPTTHRIKTSSARDQQTFRMAAFVQQAVYESLDASIIDQLKKHLLDAAGSLLLAADKPTPQKLIRQIKQLSEGGKCKAPKTGNIATDRAAQLYTALIRYPDFMDNFLGKEATCHPSDNIGPLLAAGQLAGSTGKDFLLAMALGYEMECRLVQEIPVMIKGFDHTSLLAYSATAAISKLLSLNIDQTANAIAMAGCSFNPLVSSRASYTSEWKGFASSLVNMGCTNIALLAREGMTGPLGLFEGPKGFKGIFNMELKYDWKKEDFSLIRKCILKSYNAEVHTQSAIEAALELKTKHGFATSNIESIDVTTFLTAFHIVGNGEYGDRMEVYTKEQADHSLPYVLAVALLDEQVFPEQFLPERINRSDVQNLMQKVTVQTASPLHRPLIIAGLLDPYTEAYPEKIPSKVEISFANGDKIKLEKEDYHGFFTRPLSWADTEKKFRKLAENIPASLQDRIVEVIGDLENRSLTELISTLTAPFAARDIPAQKPAN